MPNIAANSLVLSGPRATLDAFKAAFVVFDTRGLHFDFERILPMPAHIEVPEPRATPPLGRLVNEDWYGWRLENWGTSWSGSDARWTDISSQCSELSFLTSSKPPVPILEALAKRPEVVGLDIRFASRCSDMGETSTGAISNGVFTYQASEMDLAA